MFGSPLQGDFVRCFKAWSTGFAFCPRTTSWPSVCKWRRPFQSSVSRSFQTESTPRSFVPRTKTGSVYGPPSDWVLTRRSFSLGDGPERKVSTHDSPRSSRLRRTAFGSTSSLLASPLLTKTPSSLRRSWTRLRSSAYIYSEGSRTAPKLRPSSVRRTLSYCPPCRKACPLRCWKHSPAVFPSSRATSRSTERSFTRTTAAGSWRLGMQETLRVCWQRSPSVSHPQNGRCVPARRPSAITRFRPWSSNIERCTLTPLPDEPSAPPWVIRPMFEDPIHIDVRGTRKVVEEHAEWLEVARGGPPDPRRDGIRRTPVDHLPRMCQEDDTLRNALRRRPNRARRARRV